MSNKKASRVDKENPVNYYDLKTDAVEDLVSALNEDVVEETPSVHKKYVREKEEGQPDPYKLDKLAMIPTWIKALFVKFWVAGAICYFFIWGLGIQVNSPLDQVFLTGIATGVIVDLFVNTAFLYFESDKKEYHPYILVPVPAKKIWSLLINIPIAILEIYLIMLFYSTVNIIIKDIKNLPEGTTTLNVEPILFGLLFVLVDMIILSIKNVSIRVYKKLKNK